MIKEFVQKTGKIDTLQNTKETIKEVEEINKEYNYFNTISDWLALAQLKQNKKGKLTAVPISVKDNICVQGVESKAGSAILHTYKPVFNATVIEKIIEEGGIIIGKNLSPGRRISSDSHPLPLSLALDLGTWRCNFSEKNPCEGGIALPPRELKVVWRQALGACRINHRLKLLRFSRLLPESMTISISSLRKA